MALWNQHATTAIYITIAVLTVKAVHRWEMSVTKIESAMNISLLLKRK
jgi:hypothetical protein